MAMNKSKVELNLYIASSARLQSGIRTGVSMDLRARQQQRRIKRRTSSVLKGVSLQSKCATGFVDTTPPGNRLFLESNPSRKGSNTPLFQVELGDANGLEAASQAVRKS